MSSNNPTSYVLCMTYNKHVGAKEEKMEWFELYEKLLNVARAEMGELCADDEVAFKKLFYDGLHDWVQGVSDNYAINEHNKGDW